MPAREAPCVELGSVPQTPTIVESPSLSEISSASSPEPQNVRATPLFRALAMPPPEPAQPPGQEELERRLPGYRRIVIPRELTLIELLKQCSGVTTDEEVLRIREAKLRVIAERVGLRRLHVLAPLLRSLILDGSALSSLRDLGIGLVHLKVLSVNRCGLTCLDGVWGLGALCEFYAAGNRLHDLQPLAALQKLHTLNLANNPIADTNRIWTLGVCGSLRRLTLSGTPAADTSHYRARVAATLPMLVYLDDHPLHADIDYEWDQMLETCGSDSEEGDEEVAQLMRPVDEDPPAEPEARPSKQFPNVETSNKPAQGGGDAGAKSSLASVIRSRRPATTEGAGARPPRPNMPARPRTAHDRPNIDAPSRLQILNTLMDEEWRCSGSKLTSHGAVCGNLTHALRRPASARRPSEADIERELVQQTMEDAARALAEEIPRVPCIEDWARFREETGIDIDIDFNQRPRDADPSEVMDRLERIEKETMERFKQEEESQSAGTASPDSTNNSEPKMLNSHDIFREIRLDQLPEPTEEVDILFNDLFRISPVHTNILLNSTGYRPQ
ncbi:unnamed protein product [Chilo suppressalis]|uniref:Dynein assembly factor 1, axonemal homolog n=1 Tax=Chilo suppressalis TaxID=168631 RepID=A0ABN8AQ42_CHISP|nr:unnamed protein product [Chilo suppressalis]